VSEVKVNKISPRSGTDVTLGDASDTFTLPSSAEIDIASGATLDVNGTIDVTGSTVTGLSATDISSGTLGTARLGTGSASSSTFLRGDQSWAAAGGDNTPSFAAILSGDQSIATSTWTKVTLDTEWWDTDSAFDIDTNVGRFTVPADKDGKYVFHYGTFIGNIDPGESVILSLVKNDSSTSGLVGFGQAREYPGAVNDHIYSTASVILDLDATDFIEFWVYQTEGGAQNAQAPNTFMSGFRLVGV